MVQLAHDDSIPALSAQEGPREALEGATCDNDLVPGLRRDELECTVREADLNTPVDRDCGQTVVRYGVDGPPLAVENVRLEDDFGVEQVLQVSGARGGGAAGSLWGAG